MPLAELLRRAGLATEAVAVLRAGLRHHPDHSPAQVVLARVHLEAGKRALAVAILEEVAAADPANTAAGTLLAGLLIDDGRFREARQLLDRLHLAWPADPLVRGLLARLAPGSAALHGAADDPFDTEAWAERLAARGDYPRATRAWQRLYSANPRHQRARGRLVELSRALEGFDSTVGSPDRPRRRLPGAGDVVRALGQDHDGPPPEGNDPISTWARPFWSR